MRAVLVLILCLAAFLTSPGFAVTPQHIYGIHTWSAGANSRFSGKRGWTAEVIWTKTEPGFNLQVSQAQQIVNENFELVIRLDWDFGEPIPVSSGNWDTFAAKCADKVTSFSAYCNIWIIGNEMNANFLTSVPPSTCVEVYRRCRTAIKAVQPNAIVVVPAVAPYNAGQPSSGPYSSAWLNYMYNLVNSLNGDADGFAIHAYGGRNNDMDPRDDDEMSFGVFKKWMEIIDANWYAETKPVYLTEFNHAIDGDKAGQPGFPKWDYQSPFIQRAYEAINTYNETHSHRIKCACWFSYANGGFPGYNISGDSTMQSDFSFVTSNTNYIGTVAGVADWSLFE